MELLKKLYEIHSPSGREKKIKQFIKRYIRANISDCIIESDKAGNIYITRGVSETYPCIVAHLDQVQTIHSSDFKAIETEVMIFGYSKKNRSFEGLGADDKNGIFIALKCLEKYDTIKIALFVKEEIGCVGSYEADMGFFADCRFVIEPDRKGAPDFITSIGFTTLCSDEFINDCNIEKFGYRETQGMMTDVLALKENGLEISCINLSCGYYEPHTNNEFTVKADLLNCLNLVFHIIENCQKVYPHKNQDLWNIEKYHYAPNYIDEYFELEQIVEELYDLDSTITADDIFFEYSQIYKHIKLEDIEDMLFSQNRKFLNY
ncbi:MAG: hypothetical protein SNI45_05555 [Rikenellaceae bacterium]